MKNQLLNNVKEERESKRHLNLFDYSLITAIGWERKYGAANVTFDHLSWDLKKEFAENKQKREFDEKFKRIAPHSVNIDKTLRNELGGIDRDNKNLINIYGNKSKQTELPYLLEDKDYSKARFVPARNYLVSSLIESQEKTPWIKFSKIEFDKYSIQALIEWYEIKKDNKEVKDAIEMSVN